MKQTYKQMGQEYLELSLLPLGSSKTIEEMGLSKLHEKGGGQKYFEKGANFNKGYPKTERGGRNGLPAMTHTV